MRFSFQLVFLQLLWQLVSCSQDQCSDPRASGKGNDNDATCKGQRVCTNKVSLVYKI